MRYKPGKIDRHSLASVGTLVLELARRRCRSCSVCTPFHQPIATVPLYEDVRRSLEPTAIRKFFGTGRSSIQWPDLNFRVAGFPRRLPALFGFRLAFRALRRPRNISPRRSCPELASFAHGLERNPETYTCVSSPYICSGRRWLRDHRAPAYHQRKRAPRGVSPHVPPLRQADDVCHLDQHAPSNSLPLRTVQNAGVDTRPKARVPCTATATATEKGQ
jgi:hypothetical protein